MRASKTGGHPELEGIQNWRASRTGGHPKLEGIQNLMRGSRFWSPQCGKRIDIGPNYTQEWRGGIRGIKTAIALEREKAAGMDKKGQTVQGHDDCAVAKGREYRACAFPASLVDAIGSTYGSACRPTDSHS